MSGDFSFEWRDSFLEIDPNEWNPLVPGDNPFFQLEFLQALEESASIGNHTPWQPKPLLIYKNQSLQGFVVLFIRTDSYGEFIFDFEWANLYHKSGIHYYPKFTCAIPFTPVIATKLISSSQDSDIWLEAIQEIQRKGGELGLSTIHFLFHADSERMHFENHDFTTRLTHQYHWINRGYREFDDFLSALKKDRRKSIKRERKALLESDLEISILEGENIDPELHHFYWNIYKSTHDKKWGQTYLTKEFFAILFQKLRKNLVLVLVQRQGFPIAGSLNFRGENVLFGRYWGSLENVEFLHFEVCYYSLIDYSIKNGFSRFEAGAQGEHKYLRGFEVVPILSSHYFYLDQARGIFRKHLRNEEENMLRAIDQWNLKSPLKLFRDQVAEQAGGVEHE